MLKRSIALALVIGLLLGAVAIGQAQTTYRWKLASVLPETHPVHRALLYFADLVNAKTNGRARVTVFAGGTLGQERDYIEAIKLGTLEFAKVSCAPLGQFSTSLQVVSLPFIFRNPEHQYAVVDGPVGARLYADLEKAGFKGLAFYAAGSRNVTTKSRPIRKPEDLQGLKIRVMESKPLIDAINAFGATAVPMGQSEVYVALQQGLIDGWENNEPTVVSFRLHEVSPFFSYTRHTSIPDILIMDPRLFARLPRDIQAAVVEAGKETVAVQRQIWTTFVDEAKEKLAAEGMKFNEVDDITAFQAKVRHLYADYAKTLGQDLIDSIIATK